MIITNQVLNNLRTTIRADFKTAFEAAQPESLALKVATLVSSSSKTNTYAWLGKFPQFREWVGERVLKNIKEHSYTLKNEKYEATREVDRTDIEDDNLGQYRLVAQSMGQEVSDFFNREIAKLLTGGFTATCYDGQHFFDKEHPVSTSTAPKEDDDPTLVSNIVGEGT
ncbi:MAG: Mu-like prophage major head subunit gpT family protein, partial [Bacteroidales bacterium]